MKISRTSTLSRTFTYLFFIYRHLSTGKFQGRFQNKQQTLCFNPQKSGHSHTCRPYNAKSIAPRCSCKIPNKFRDCCKHVWDFSHIINCKDIEEETPLSALPNERTVEQFPFCVRLNFYYYIYNYIYNNKSLCTFLTQNCSTVRSFAQRLHQVFSILKRLTRTTGNS